MKNHRHSFLVGSAVFALLVSIPLNFAMPGGCGDHGGGGAGGRPGGETPRPPPPTVPQAPIPDPTRGQKPAASKADEEGYDDLFESDEDQAKREAQEKAKKDAKAKDDRIKGKKKEYEQPLQEDTKMKIGGDKMPNTIVFAGHQTMIVDQYGYPIRGKLADDSRLWVRLQEGNGEVKGGFVKFAEGTEVTLKTTKDGEDYVTKGTLADDTRLPTGGGGSVVFKEGTETTFDTGTGTVKSGTLKGDAELPVDKQGHTETFADGTKVAMDPKTGVVTAHTPPPR
jgi:hypothetical protein